MPPVQDFSLDPTVGVDVSGGTGGGGSTHWGQGYPEMSGNILGTFQGLGQFYCTVTNRYIYGTFRMCC